MRFVFLGALLSLTTVGAYAQGQTPLIALATTTTLTGPQSSTYGQTVQLVATVVSIGVVAPSGTVIFEDPGVGGTLGSVALTAIEGTRSSQATLSTSVLTVGPHGILALYQGNNSNAGSDSAALPLTVGKAATKFAYLVALPDPPIPLNQPVTLGAGINFPGAIPPTGTVAFEDTTLGVTLGSEPLLTAPGSATTSLIYSSSVGHHTVTAQYQGDANYLPCSSQPVSFTVTQGLTTFIVTTNASPSTFGQQVTFTATDEDFSGQQGSPPPTGTVTFKDGSTTLGTGLLNGGVA
ncbi:MAG: Ig-like domain-containing protein, partial [Bryobacteraceae bacterium]